MKDAHLRGELLQTEGELQKTTGQTAGDPEAIEAGQRRQEAGRQADATGDIQEVLFGEPPGAEDDADGII